MAPSIVTGTLSDTLFFLHDSGDPRSIVRLRSRNTAPETGVAHRPDVIDWRAREV
jgi:hypothetical protein